MLLLVLIVVKKDSSLKRGKIYAQTKSFKCWNGGCFKYRPLNFLLSDFGNDSMSFTEKESMMVQHVVQNTNNKKSLAEFYNKDVLFDKNEIIRLLKAKPIKSSIKGLKYLESRKANKVGLDDLAYNDYFDNLIFLNMFEDKVIGVQIRLSKPMKNGGRFMSYDYEDIITKLYKKGEGEYDVNLAKSMKKVSLTYNILNINFQQKVNVFESTLDSKYFNNSIALWGANNMLEIPNGYYFMDNDEAGRVEAMKLLNKNLNVFLWRKFFKDYPEYEYHNRQKTKDINDIFRINKMFNVNLLYNYMGNHKLDSIML